MEEKSKKNITVEEAGRMGGQKEKDLVKEGHEYESKIGRKTEKEIDKMEEMEE